MDGYTAYSPLGGTKNPGSINPMYPIAGALGIKLKDPNEGRQPLKGPYTPPPSNVATGVVRRQSDAGGSPAGMGASQEPDGAKPTFTGPSLEGITTGRPFSTSDADFARTGRFNEEDMGSINARIRERQSAQANTAGAIGPNVARVTDAQGRTTYSGSGDGAADTPFSYVDQLRRLQAIDSDKYGGAAAPDIGNMTIPQIMAYKVGLAKEMAGKKHTQEFDMRRQLAAEDRAAALPEREARIGEAQARTKLLGTQEEAAQLSAFTKRQEVALRKKIADKNTPEADKVAYRAELKRLEDRAADEKIRIEVAKQKAMMGEPVEGYADGGAIGRSETGQLSPLMAQYGQYVQAAAQSGVTPVPFPQYMNLMATTRAGMTQTPTQFADGGDVSELSRPVEGPGTGVSDSIPAVIDGEKPAALSRGEFVIPEHVVRKKGTEFFEKLIAQYSEEEKANG